LYDGFALHDRFVTMGLLIGRGSTIPTVGKEWIPSLPPVVLSFWPYSMPERPYFTSVLTWRGPFGPLERNGHKLGLRVHEFRRFANLPQLCRAKLELALDIDEADQSDVRLLVDSGWQLVDPRGVAEFPQDYQRYIHQSAGEFMVAKQMYVSTRSGWFSDRSACYLASGRPVVAQDTGWSTQLPAGTGLLAFADPDEAALGLNMVIDDHERHSRIAREIAVDCLSSTVVLPRLLDSIGAS
jgi:hypothetical protein